MVPIRRNPLRPHAKVTLDYGKFEPRRRLGEASRGLHVPLKTAFWLSSILQLPSALHLLLARLSSPRARPFSLLSLQLSLFGQLWKGLCCLGALYKDSHIPSKPPVLLLLLARSGNVTAIASAECDWMTAAELEGKPCPLRNRQRVVPASQACAIISWASHCPRFLYCP